MDIHHLYAQLFKIFRAKRMLKFEQLLQPHVDENVLDVGGYPATWITRPQLTHRIDCLNIHPVDWDTGNSPEHQITTQVGNGCELAFEDGSYEILFSNSVIEHVGVWEQQRAFAREARRVGQKLWIQTPAWACPIEPHYLALFVHWFPVGVRRRLLRWFTPWGWMTKPSQAKVDQTIAFTRLLTKRQVKELFPDCEIVTERLFWIFPKSYIAYRVSGDSTSVNSDALPSLAK